MGVSLSLTSFYEDYKNGKCLSQIGEQVYNFYMDSQLDLNGAESVADKILDFESIKDHIIFQVINTKLNKELLENVPYIECLDLAIICRYKLNEMSVIINNQIIDKWNISKEDLFMVADENTPKLLPHKFRGLGEMIQDVMEDCDSDIDVDTPKAMYVLTNRESIWGASCIFYDGLVKSIADKLGCDLFILPSSIHEVIIMPTTCGSDVESLNQMVREVNETEVKHDEILSDHCYIFSKEKNKIILP